MADSRSVRFHRVLTAKPEKVYKAFVDADAYARWIPPNGFTGRVHTMEPRVGGKYHMSFTHFGSGNAHSFGGEYRELVPGQRVRYSARFDDPNLPGEMETTVELRAVSCGTDVSIVQTGIPEGIPLEMCHLGWQESLANLARLVEPDIPG